MPSAKRKIRPSILDRLAYSDDGDIESASSETSSHITHRFESEAIAESSLRKLKESVRRDLESLLNTRVPVLSVPDEYFNAKWTVIEYGMPDLASVNLEDVDQQDAFVRRMESVIRRYEPRFKQISVVVDELSKVRDRTFRFRIEGTLYADPAPEFVTFDSSLEPNSRSISVQKADGSF